MYLGDYGVLDALANPIDRAAVTEWFMRIHDPVYALDAYVASYLWGYARAEFGPYRAARVMRLNTDAENGKDFRGELHTLARIAMEEGGVAALQHVMDERARSRKFFEQWGPAFATKFISYATKASPAVDTTTIMDTIVTGWFAEHCGEIGPLRLNWHSADSYRRYTGCIAVWAEDLGLEPEQVEQLIFGD